MDAIPSASLSLRLCSSLFRTLPPGTRGKGRLARLVLSSQSRTQPVAVKTTSGARMLVPNLQEPVGLSLWLDGVYEPETLAFLERYARPDGVFLDVGANVGAFTVPLAARSKHVIAVEPSSRVLPFLRQNVALNQLANVTVAACAASQPGVEQVPLYIPPDSHFGMASSAPQFSVEPVSIPARTVDALVAEHAPGPVSVMKVDTEGYEAHVFLGARELLRSAAAPPIIFEFCDWAEDRAFAGRKGWAQQILLEAGYRLWSQADHDAGRPPLAAPLTEGSHSMVALPPGL